MPPSARFENSEPKVPSCTLATDPGRSQSGRVTDWTRRHRDTGKGGTKHIHTTVRCRVTGSWGAPLAKHSHLSPLVTTTPRNHHPCTVHHPPARWSPPQQCPCRRRWPLTAQTACPCACHWAGQPGNTHIHECAVRMKRGTGCLRFAHTALPALAMQEHNTPSPQPPRTVSRCWNCHWHCRGWNRAGSSFRAARLGYRLEYAGGGCTSGRGLGRGAGQLVFSPTKSSPMVESSREPK
jgi:hypothetical protein